MVFWTWFFIKVGHRQPLFRLFRSFQTSMQVYYKCLNAKNGQSTLYPALGFELVISRTWVSSRNQLTTSSDRFIWFEKFLYRTSKQLLQWNSLPMCLDKAQLVTLPGHYLYLHRTFLPTSYLPTYIVPTYLHRTYLPTSYLRTSYLPTYLPISYLRTSYLLHRCPTLFNIQKIN